MKRIILLAATHLAALGAGFGLGVYLLPIIIEEDAPDAVVLEQAKKDASYSVALTRELRGSDALHWGEGEMSIAPRQISHRGELAPGPNYKLYLTKQFVEHEDEFEPIKSQAALVGDIRSFDGFLLEVPSSIDIEDYNTAVIWCERFGEFITAVQYR